MSVAFYSTLNKLVIASDRDCYKNPQLTTYRDKVAVEGPDTTDTFSIQALQIELKECGTEIL